MCGWCRAGGRTGGAGWCGLVHSTLVQGLGLVANVWSLLLPPLPGRCLGRGLLAGKLETYKYSFTPAQLPASSSSSWTSGHFQSVVSWWRPGPGVSCLVAAQEFVMFCCCPVSISWAGWHHTLTRHTHCCILHSNTPQTARQQHLSVNSQQSTSVLFLTWGVDIEI